MKIANFIAARSLTNNPLIILSIVVAVIISGGGLVFYNEIQQTLLKKFESSNSQLSASIALISEQDIRSTDTEYLRNLSLSFANNENIVKLSFIAADGLVIYENNYQDMDEELHPHSKVVLLRSAIYETAPPETEFTLDNEYLNGSLTAEDSPKNREVLAPKNNGVEMIGWVEVVVSDSKLQYRFDYFKRAGLFIVVIIIFILKLAIYLTNKIIKKQQHEIEAKNQTLIKKKNELEDAWEKEKEANKAKFSFLSQMNHQLRTPVASIKERIAKLRNTDIHSTQQRLNYKQDLMKAENTAKRMLELINQLLDYTQLDNQQKKANLEKTALQSLLRGVSDIVYERHQSSIPMYFYLEDNIPQHIITDRNILTDILQNLLDNAHKFTERGSITLHIKKIDDELFFEVSDTGKGIPKDKQARIFEPFHQTERKLNKTQEGNGLGLSIVKQHVDLLEGDIDLKSYPTGSKSDSKGSRFTVRLPFIAVESGNFRCQVATKNVILNIDDPVFHFYLKGVFARWNFIIHEKNSKVLPENTLILESYGIDQSHNNAPHLRLFVRNKPETHIQLATCITPEELCEAIATLLSENTDYGRSSLVEKRYPILDNKMLLFAEDEPDLNELYSEFLYDQGVRLIAVSDGEQALKEGLARPIDAAILDINMPLLSGLDVIKALRQQKPDLICIAFTAFQEPEKQAECLAAGFNAIASKTDGRESVLQVISQCLENPQNTQIVMPALTETLSDEVFAEEHAMTQIGTKEKLCQQLPKFLQRLQTTRMMFEDSAADAEQKRAETHKIRGLSPMHGAFQLHQQATILENAYDAVISDTILQQTEADFIKAVERYSLIAHSFLETQC